MMMLANRSMPASIVIPTLPYADVTVAAAWLERVFGFSVRLTIGDHRVQIVTPEGGDIVLTRASGDVAHALIMVRVADVDAVHTHADAEGAEVRGAPQNQPYGERQFTAIDCGGHAWTFSQSIAEVPPESWGGVTGPGFR